MEALKVKARELLTSGAVNVVVGYGKGSGDRMRPVFIKKPQDADSLEWNDRCEQNLAVYITKPELKKLGKIGLVAPAATVRAVLQLASENQIQDGSALLIGIDDSKVRDFATLQEAQSWIAEQPLQLEAQDERRLQEIAQMSMDQRWEFWQEELSRCFKCYACRAACPMCYCSRCTVECNQPQWIPVASHQLGNFEWHMARAMHLAGRCVSCGACGKACPLDIPIHLLTMKVEEDIHQEFGIRAGVGTAEHALSTYRPDDKENFII
jgi:ferredoxin